MGCEPSPHPPARTLQVKREESWAHVAGSKSLVLRADHTEPRAESRQQAHSRVHSRAPAMQALNCTTARQASSLRAGPSGRHVVPSAPLRKRRSGLQTTQAFGGETDIVTAVAPTVAALVLGGVLLALPGSEQEVSRDRWRSRGASRRCWALTVRCAYVWWVSWASYVALGGP